MIALPPIRLEFSDRREVEDPGDSVQMGCTRLLGLTFVLLAALFSSSRTSVAAIPAAANSLPLAESNRVFIAEIERRGLTLTRRGFPAVAATIRTNAADRLMRYLAPGFRGETLSPEQGLGPENDVLKIRRVTSAGEPKQKPVSADADAFARYLLELRHHFGADARVELALMSLSPAQREKLDGP